MNLSHVDSGDAQGSWSMRWRRSPSRARSIVWINGCIGTVAANGQVVVSGLSEDQVLVPKVLDFATGRKQKQLANALAPR